MDIARPFLHGGLQMLEPETCSVKSPRSSFEDLTPGPKWFHKKTAELITIFLEAHDCLAPSLLLLPFILAPKHHVTVCVVNDRLPAHVDSYFDQFLSWPRPRMETLYSHCYRGTPSCSTRIWGTWSLHWELSAMGANSCISCKKLKSTNIKSTQSWRQSHLVCVLESCLFIWRDWNVDLTWRCLTTVRFNQLVYCMCIRGGGGGTL